MLCDERKAEAAQLYDLCAYPRFALRFIVEVISSVLPVDKHRSVHTLYPLSTSQWERAKHSMQQGSEEVAVPQFELADARPRAAVAWRKDTKSGLKASLSDTAVATVLLMMQLHY